ncbi:hypothetical protein [Bacillus mobilis]|uniref:hypothetical protein n=1 Tax=Bacillus mobilis TaxID=2026190 RepID=UPI0022E00DDD|nr:hypothetical protein [Bacillus mobilis]
MITGDSIVSENGRIKGPISQFTPDMDTALESIKKFTNYNIEAIVCYHDGLCTDNINQQLLDLIKQ